MDTDLHSPRINPNKHKEKIWQDNKIKADFVKLRKALNVAKKEIEPRISRIFGGHREAEK